MDGGVLLHRGGLLLHMGIRGVLSHVGRLLDRGRVFPESGYTGLGSIPGCPFSIKSGTHQCTVTPFSKNRRVILQKSKSQILKKGGSFSNALLRNRIMFFPNKYLLKINKKIN